MSTGMGLIPITWQEFRAWRMENHLHLTLWEIETIKKMSEAYCNEYAKATDPNRQPPYSIDVEDDPAKQEELALKQALSWRKTIRSAAKQKV